jgi:hypothetical protein
MTDRYSQKAQSFWKGLQDDMNRRLRAVMPFKALAGATDPQDPSRVQLVRIAADDQQVSESAQVLASGTPPAGAELVVARLPGGQKVVLGHVGSAAGDDGLLLGEVRGTPGLVPAGQTVWIMVSVPGAQRGDLAFGSFDALPSAKWEITAVVAQPDVVAVGIENQTGAPASLPQGTIRAGVLRRFAVGPAGPQGASGSAGPRGARGLDGPLGPVGPTGPAGGPTGPTGLQGAQGFTGSTGAQGPQGSQGPQGFTGRTGPTGLQGAQGVQGSQGPQGFTGPLGLTGAGVGLVWLRRTWDSGVTDADPGTGRMSFNHATYASVTRLFIDTHNGATDETMVIETLDDAVNATRGYLQVQAVSDPLGRWVRFKIIANVETAAGYRKVWVQHVASSSLPLVDESLVDLVFVPAGDQGPQGTQGHTGPTGAVGAQGAAGSLSIERDGAVQGSFTTLDLDGQEYTGVAAFDQYTLKPSRRWSGEITSVPTTVNQRVRIGTFTAGLDPAHSYCLRVTVIYAAGNGSSYSAARHYIIAQTNLFAAYTRVVAPLVDNIQNQQGDVFELLTESVSGGTLRLYLRRKVGSVGGRAYIHIENVGHGDTTFNPDFSTVTSDSTAHAFLPGVPGYALIDGWSFSGVANTFRDNVFLPAYEDYDVILRYAKSTDVLTAWKFRVNGTDVTANLYSTNLFIVGYTTIGNTNAGNSANPRSILNGTVGGVLNDIRAEINVNRPRVADQTVYRISQGGMLGTTTSVGWIGFGSLNAIDQVDGIKVETDSGTLTGNAFVYARSMG